MKLRFILILMFLPLILVAEIDEVFCLEKGFQLILTKDKQDRVLRRNVKDEKGKTVLLEELEYSASGNLLEIKDGFYRDGEWKTQMIRMFYNAENQLTEFIRGFGTQNERKTIFLYDENGILIERTNPNGVKIFYQYDGLSNCEIQSSDNTVDYLLTYNDNGYLIRAEDRINNQTIYREVDDCGNITKEIFPNEEEIETFYDDQGRIEIIKGINIGEVQYEYVDEDLLKVKRFSSFSGRKYDHTYQYDQNGNILKEDLIGQLGQIIYERDLNKKEIIVRSPYSLEKCYYDSVGNLIYRKLNEKEFNYEYDPLGQLINYDEFDFIRNPINSNINELNELLEYGAITCEYDLNGSLIAKHTPDKSYFFRFDALGRLIQINSENLELHFTYDPLGRRLSKSIFRDGEETRETYLYQNKNEIASFKDGKLKEIRIPGKSFHENIVKSIAIEINGKTYAPIYDIQGNILKLIDIDNKGVIEVGPFDLFGSDLEDLFQEDYSSWVFSSKRFDPETNLVYFGHRYYDPSLKRWISTDPLGAINGINFYSYVLNNPFRYVDPDGRFVFAIPLVVWGGASITEIIVTTIAAGAASWIGHEIGNVLDKKIKDKKWKSKEKDEYKKLKPRISGKEGAKDVPSWAKGEKPYKSESGNDFAKRLLNEKYGPGNYKKGSSSDFNKIRKWGDRSFD